MIAVATTCFSSSSSFFLSYLPFLCSSSSFTQLFFPLHPFFVFILHSTVCFFRFSSYNFLSLFFFKTLPLPTSPLHPLLCNILYTTFIFLRYGSYSKYVSRPSSPSLLLFFISTISTQPSFVFFVSFLVKRLYLKNK